MCTYMCKQGSNLTRSFGMYSQQQILHVSLSLTCPALPCSSAAVAGGAAGWQAECCMLGSAVITAGGVVCFSLRRSEGRWYSTMAPLLWCVAAVEGCPDSSGACRPHEAALSPNATQRETVIDITTSTVATTPTIR